jgi:hypothetical protein
LEKKNNLLRVSVSIQKPGVQEKGCCCVTNVVVCDTKKSKLSMERETLVFVCVIKPLCCFLKYSPKPPQRWLTSAWNPYVLSSNLVID